MSDALTCDADYLFRRCSCCSSRSWSIADAWIEKAIIVTIDRNIKEASSLI